jgi:spermidine/putrescine transport system permease protein
MRADAFSPAKAVAWIYLGLVLLFLYLPNLVVTVMSFNSSRLAAFPIEDLSLEWWSRLSRNDAAWAATKNSLVVATSTTVVALVLGLLAAYALVRLDFRLKPLLTGLLVTVLLVPPLVVGIGLLAFWSLIDAPQGLHLVVLGHVALALPFTSFVLAARLQGFDRSLEEAAASLGAGRLLVLRRVVLPSLMPGIIAAAAFTFAISVDEFNLAFFLAGADNTLPIYIYGSLRFGGNPEISALSTVLLLFSMGAAAVALRRA